MSTETIESLLPILESRIKQDLETQNYYETLQYIKSFIARKKKIFGKKGISLAVFTSAKLFLQYWNPTFASITGDLLKWYIEDGAGIDLGFYLLPDQLNHTNFCDIEQLYQLLLPLDNEKAGPIVDMIYNPLHMLIAKTPMKRNSQLSQRIYKLELLLATHLLHYQQFFHAFKSFIRLQDAEQVAEVLHQWSMKGNQTEKLYFFGRGLLYLLSEHKMEFAKDVLYASNKFVDPEIKDLESRGLHLPSLTLWHVSLILTELANLPPMQRVDKTKLFGILYKRYGLLLIQIDQKVYELFVKIGSQLFHYVTPEQQRDASNNAGPNPMALLQGLLGGGGGGNAFGGSKPQGLPAGLPSGFPQGMPSMPPGFNPGNMNLDALMNMMSKLS